MENVPDALLKHIFSDVGDAWDFRSCERTCKAFRRVLEDDAVWGTCEECQPKYQDQQRHWPTQNREKAFVVRALVHCHNWQRRGDSVLRSVLSVREWKHLVSQSLSLLLHDNIGRNFVKCCDTFPLRGDTSAVLMAIVEHCLISQLHRANSLAVHLVRKSWTPVRDERGEMVPIRENFTRYPSIHMGDYVMQDHFMNFHNQPTERTAQSTGLLAHLVPRPVIQDIAATISTRLDLDRTKRHRIVRRLAYRAGVTKMEDQVFRLVWTQLVFLIVKLMDPACIQLADRPVFTSDKHQTLEHMETMRDVPPLVELADTPCPRCGQRQAIHTIVPKQIQDAAERLGISSKVYGAEWHVETDSEDIDYAAMVGFMEQEIAEAASKYGFVGTSKKSPPQLKPAPKPEIAVGRMEYDGLVFFDAHEVLPEESGSDIVHPIDAQKTESHEADQTDSEPGNGSYASDDSSSESSDDESYVQEETSDDDNDALDDLSEVSEGEIADLVQGVAEEAALHDAAAIDIADDAEDNGEGVDADLLDQEVDDGDSDSGSDGSDSDDSASVDSDCGTNDESYVPGDTSDEEDLDLSDVATNITEGFLSSEPKTIVKASSDYPGNICSRDLYTPA